MTTLSVWLIELPGGATIEVQARASDQISHVDARRIAGLVMPSIRSDRDPSSTDCATDDVYLTLRPAEIVDGHGHAEIIVTNIGASPCSLPSSLAVEVDFLIAPPPPSTPSPDELQNSIVVLPRTDSGTDDSDPMMAPGQSVAVLLTWTETGSGLALDGQRYSVTSLRVVGRGGIPGDISGTERVRMQPDGLTFQAPVTTDFGGPIGRAMFEPSGAVAYVNPADPTDTLSIYGLGAVRVDMTMQEVADATGHRVVVTEWGDVSGGCGFALIGGVSQIGIRLDGPDESSDPGQAVVGAVDVSGPYRTGTGIGVGSTFDDLQDAWGDQASEIIPGLYADAYVRFTPSDPAEAEFEVVAWLDDERTVTRLVAGHSGSAGLQEGCL